MSLDQEDGSRWNVYENPDDPREFTILTGSGQDLFKDPKRSAEARGLIHEYRGVELGNIPLLGTTPGMREELGRGQEAIAYRMGPYAVREVIGIKDFHSAYGELDRVDAINTVIEAGLPRWLHLPLHYALHVDPKEQKTYTLMDRIDSGITAEDIIEYPDIPEHRARVVEREIGHRIEDAKDKVPGLFDEAHTVLSEALSAKGKNPSNYLTDWQTRNVLVEPLETPVVNRNYSMYVIDQYRA